MTEIKSEDLIKVYRTMCGVEQGDDDNVSAVLATAIKVLTLHINHMEEGK